MSSALFVTIGALVFSTLNNNTNNNSNLNNTAEGIYYGLPKFWTNTGFCPSGSINHYEITESLFSEATQLNLRFIAALPTGAAITHIRIHWLLELLTFVQFNQEGVPIYDFTKLDKFIEYLDDLGLLPVVEFMANPGNVFKKNPTHNAFLWENFSFQVAKHYLKYLGTAKLLRWRFETWNEPDVKNYNRLNFTTEDYLTYVESLKRGLTAAGQRSNNNLNFALRGPAGLFKSEHKHPLCWQMLEQCNNNIDQCPLEALTYHKKGNGFGAAKLLEETSILLKNIYEKYPNLKFLPIANDEADPISNWSEPRDFHEDVRYAYTLVLIILKHWSAKLRLEEFKMFESLSHDNAFLSYHPYEFSQRTLLAHFRMNSSNPIHSQFIQKPVYAALGMLSKLSPMAADLETVTTVDGNQFYLLKTSTKNEEPLCLSYLLIPVENNRISGAISFELGIPPKLLVNETFMYIIEILDNDLTNPSDIWHQYNSPPYPNAYLRETMRRSQTPLLLASGIVNQLEYQLDYNMRSLSASWIMLFRVCSNQKAHLKAPQQLIATQITHDEVLLTWKEIISSVQCLKTYEVWFKSDEAAADWSFISKGWHIPFPSFHYAPNSSVNGFYKVRGIDAFDVHSKFSDITEYIEI